MLGAQKVLGKSGEEEHLLGLLADRALSTSFHGPIEL